MSKGHAQKKAELNKISQGRTQKTELNKMSFIFTQTGDGKLSVKHYQFHQTISRAFSISIDQCELIKLSSGKSFFFKKTELNIDDYCLMVD